MTSRASEAAWTSACGQPTAALTLHVRNVFDEIMAENVPNMKKETDIQVQEAQRFPNKMNPNRPTPRHIIIKMAKVK